MNVDETLAVSEMARRVLGPAAASHLPVIDRVVGGLPIVRYSHMNSDDFVDLAKADPVAGMRVYWTEILYRAHFSASASLVRTKRWLDGLLAMATTSNYLGFMACFRGFLESSADSFYSLGKVSLWLADFHVVIRSALRGELDQPSFFPDLENALIHFVHARRVEKHHSAPDEHRARTVKEYIESLVNSEDNRVAECYRLLCDATHPAVGSLLCYVDAARPANSEGFAVTTRQDADWILSFGRDHQDVSTRLMFFGVVPPLMMLRLINEFGVVSLHTPSAMAVGAESHSMWSEIATRLADPRRPEERAGVVRQGAV